MRSRRSHERTSCVTRLQLRSRSVCAITLGRRIPSCTRSQAAISRHRPPCSSRMVATFTSSFAAIVFTMRVIAGCPAARWSCGMSLFRLTRMRCFTDSGHCSLQRNMLRRKPRQIGSTAAIPSWTNSTYLPR
jgi:hypothetical protein